MKIEIIDNQPLCSMQIIDHSGKPQELKFLIDTGFTGSILLPVDKN